MHAGMTEIDAPRGDPILSLLKAGLDGVDQGITIFGPDLKLVFANRRLHDLVGLPEALMAPGTDFETLVRYNAECGEYGLGDIEAMVRERVAAARRFEPHTLERTRPNGVVLRVSGWPLPEGGFASIYTDITDQRRRELALERRILRQTEDLRASEERLRLIANEVPAGIAYLDGDEVFRFVNQRFAAAYGRAPADVVGRTSTAVLSPHTMARVQPFFRRAQQGEALDFDLEIEFPDGRLLDTRTFLRPDRDEAGTPRGFYVLTVNVTKQKKAAAALLQAQKMEVVGQLSSGIAHDFNNLLTIILGNLTPLAERVEDEELCAEMIAPAIRATRRGADLTRRLLAVARRQPLEPAAVDVGDTARSIAQLVRPSLTEGARIEVDAPEPACCAFVDPAQLEMSLLNLAVNARDALAGDGRIRIAVRRRALSETEAARLGLCPGDYVEVTVADDGTGMSRETRERIFEPFFSTKSERERSGLGLTIVQGFVQESRGHIDVTTAAGEGSTFTLLLPACVAGAVAPEAQAGALGSALQGLILLVDDDDEVRAVLRRELLGLGCRVIEARTAVEALDLLACVKGIALVLSDIAMPGGMSGLDLAERVRLDHPDKRVVLITGFGREGLDGPLCSDVRILQKPFGRRTLVNALREERS